MDARLQYLPKIGNFVETKNDLWTLQFFDFFYLMSSSAGNTIQKHSLYFLISSLIVNKFENKSTSVNILILLFYICPLRV